MPVLTLQMRTRRLSNEPLLVRRARSSDTNMLAVIARSRDCESLHFTASGTASSLFTTVYIDNSNMLVLRDISRACLRKIFDFPMFGNPRSGCLLVVEL